MAIMSQCLRFGICFRRCNKNMLVRTIPCGDLVPPPQLTRNAPWLDIFQPLEIGFLPILGNKLGLAGAHSSQSRLGQRFGIDIPLIGQPWFDHDIGPVAMRHHHGGGLNGCQITCFMQKRNHDFTGGKTIKPMQRHNRRPINPRTKSKIGIAGERDAGF